VNNRHARHHLLALVFCCAWVLAKDPALLPAPSNLAELRARLGEHVNQARFAAAQWGVAVVSLDTGKPLFGWNAGKLLVPASTAKLFTAALALDRLGPDFRARTSLYVALRPSDAGVLRGDLVLYGRGDPAIAARFSSGDLGRALGPLAERLAAAGVKRIQGDLVADDTFFAGPPHGTGWEWDDLVYGYGAEVSALTLNDNALEVQVRPAARVGQPALLGLSPATDFLTIRNRTSSAPAGTPRALRFHRSPDRNILVVSGSIPLNDSGYTESISVHQPARWFGLELKRALVQHGIALTGRVRASDGLEDRVARPGANGLIELAGQDSPPLRELLGMMLKPSQNLHAQLLLLQVGARAAQTSGVAAREAHPASDSDGAAAPSTEALGLRALQSFCREAGVDPGEVLLEEGAGLSRRDLLTPAALVKLLEFMDKHPHGKVFREALPLAGAEGTLKDRMTDTPAAGNVRAKTGTLSRVHGLAGYVTTLARERLAFALLLNQYQAPAGGPAPRADLDAIVVMLAGLNWRSAAGAE
jgi:D-alanyl-D-alanine carboxypeptidase/D-alanyl-D-alanine-endopeptidase (penicillin-binding protein 4)